MKSLIFLAFLYFLHLPFARAQSVQEEPIRVKAPEDQIVLTPQTLLFDPEKNGVIKEKQKIDYDLSTGHKLRLGPYNLDENSVSMQLSREQGEFLDVEFGLEIKRHTQPIYVISFAWPLDYVTAGTLEIINDKSEKFWETEISEADVTSWRNLVQKPQKFSDAEVVKLKQQIEDKELKEKIGLSRPQTLNTVHRRSNYGRSHRNFYEIPIAQMREPFRFCLAQRDALGRVALCSRRYRFTRTFGQYAIERVKSNIQPKVYVNDKPSTLRGTAVFLDFETPIKFSALLSDGSYFEFVSGPQPIELVDMVHDKKANKVHVIGYGHEPMGFVNRNFYADNVSMGFLNFMPTIGDLRNYWRAAMDPEAPFLYVKGKGGAPFRQSFAFSALPQTTMRPQMDSTVQKSTYNYKAYLKGTSNRKLKLSTPKDQADASVRRLERDEFEWTFISPEAGKFNDGILEVTDGTSTWKSEYRLFRGYPGEIGLRTTAVVSDSLDIVVLGEVGGQYWFENVLGSESYRFSRLRWGVSGKYFQTLLIGKDDPDNQGITDIKVMEANLKYRLDPGIWTRDPTVGLIFGYQDVAYSFRDEGNDFTSKSDMVGLGVFWARSMPRVFDDVFNIIPYFRYPKWVDMEAIYYPMALDPGTTARLNLAFNFHGKILWSDRFFGEAGFGMKLFNYEDTKVNEGTKVGLGLAYGTVGLGMNF